MSRSPDWFRDGVRPTHGPTFFEEVNRAITGRAEPKVCALNRS
jgi:hypothetical protein